MELSPRSLITRPIAADTLAFDNAVSTPAINARLGVIYTDGLYGVDNLENK